MNQTDEPHRARGERRSSRHLAASIALTLGLATIVTSGLVAHADDPPASVQPAGDPTTTSTSVAPATTVATPTAPTTTTTLPTPPSSPPPTVTSTTIAPVPVEATPAPPALPVPAAQHVTVYPSQIASILATIRYLESRGQYHIPTNRGGASGAYQFIISTWNNHGGYSEAYLAPPAVQDERAAADVTRFLAQWNNDVSMIPVMWYYPRAAREPALMDIVPVPSAGNVLTVREYQQRWLGVWASLAGQPIPQPIPQLIPQPNPQWTPQPIPQSDPQAIPQLIPLPQGPPPLGSPPELPPLKQVDLARPAAERTATVAFPVLGPTRLAAPHCGETLDGAQDAADSASQAAIDAEAAGLCAEQAPGVVFGVQLQPVLSVTDGVVTDVVDVPGKPIGVTVTNLAGRSYHLTGFNDDNPGTDDGAAPGHLRLTPLARVGASVRAGQVLGFMGNTDPLPLGIRSDVPTADDVDVSVDVVAPHIRLTIRDIDDTTVDAYGPVVDAMVRQACSVATGPWSSPPQDSGHDPITVETTDDELGVDSKWVITAAGQVNASGWAAMIYPSEGCGSAPDGVLGPGADGATDVPASWLTPIDLSTSIWVGLAIHGNAEAPQLPLRRP